jgi:hypothetical protein
MTQSGGSVIFNADLEDYDFRVGASGATYGFVVDAGTNRVGIGVAPSEDLHVIGKIRTNDVFNIAGSDGANYYSDGGGSAPISFFDAMGQTNTVTIRGGLIISWTQA